MKKTNGWGTSRVFSSNQFLNCAFRFICADSFIKKPCIGWFVLECTLIKSSFRFGDPGTVSRPRRRRRRRMETKSSSSPSRSVAFAFFGSNETIRWENKKTRPRGLWRTIAGSWTEEKEKHWIVIFSGKRPLLEKKNVWLWSNSCWTRGTAATAATAASSTSSRPSPRRNSRSTILVTRSTPKRRWGHRFGPILQRQSCFFYFHFWNTKSFERIRGRTKRHPLRYRRKKRKKNVPHAQEKN